jgi:hypothetical protein
MLQGVHAGRYEKGDILEHLRAVKQHDEQLEREHDDSLERHR